MMRPEMEQSVGGEQHEGALGEPFERQRPQDHGVTQGTATQHDRRVLSRSAGRRLAEDEITTAQAAPGRTDRSTGMQPGPQRLLVRRVRDVAAPPAYP